MSNARLSIAMALAPLFCRTYCCFCIIFFPLITQFKGISLTAFIILYARDGHLVVNRVYLVLIRMAVRYFINGAFPSVFSTTFCQDAGIDLIGDDGVVVKEVVQVAQDYHH